MAQKKKNKFKSSRQDLVFYSLLMIWPLAQFAVFYVGVNVNSFALAFQKIDLLNGTTWTLGGNFKEIFVRLTAKNFLVMTKNSVLAWLISLCVTTPLGLLFSYYIYKKMPGAGAFRAILFMPSIVSSIVLTTIFMKFADTAFLDFFEDNFGLRINNLFDAKYGKTFGTVMFYNVWIGFGTSVLMYSNGMAGISPEIVDSAHLDGAVGIREFWHITLPLVFPTLSVFLVTGVAGIFINQINLYAFFGGKADSSVHTFGYYLYMETKRADGSYAEYPRLAAFGLMLTAVAVPLTLIVRKLLDKFGPSED